jgi:hypothetical protein
MRWWATQEIETFFIFANFLVKSFLFGKFFLSAYGHFFVSRSKNLDEVIQGEFKRLIFEIYASVGNEWIFFRKFYWVLW